MVFLTIHVQVLSKCSCTLNTCLADTVSLVNDKSGQLAPLVQMLQYCHELLTGTDLQHHTWLHICSLLTPSLT